MMTMGRAKSKKEIRLELSLERRVGTEAPRLRGLRVLDATAETLFTRAALLEPPYWRPDGLRFGRGLEDGRIR